MSRNNSLKIEEPVLDFDWRFAGEPEAWMGLRSAKTFAPRQDDRQGDRVSLATALLRWWRPSRSSEHIAGLAR